MSAYRSREPGGHIEGIDALEAQLLRGVRRRRLVMGFLALTVGVALLVVGGLMLAQSFGHFGGRELIRTGFLSLLGGVALLVVGFVILRVGEIRSGLEVAAVDPIPWSTLGLVSAGLLVVFGLVAAWPLGIYAWADSLRSPCRSFFRAGDVARLQLAPFDVGHVQNDRLVCVLTGTEPGTERRIVSIVLAGDKGGSQFPNELKFLGGTRTPIDGLGDEAYLVERSGERIVVARRRHAAMLIHLSAHHYDHEAALRIAEHAKSKLSLVEPYADTWKRKYGSD